jgi:hypothetical protein
VVGETWLWLVHRRLFSPESSKDSPDSNPNPNTFMAQSNVLIGEVAQWSLCTPASCTLLFPTSQLVYQSSLTSGAATLAGEISHPSVLGVQSTQPRGNDGIAEHARTHCRAHSEGARDIRCVRHLRFAQLYACAAASAEEAGWAADRSVMQQLITQPYCREAKHPPELQQQGQAKVHQQPCTLPHLEDGGVEVRDRAALQHQARRHLSAGPIHDRAAREGRHGQKIVARCSSRASLNGVGWVW